MFVRTQAVVLCALGLCAFHPPTTSAAPVIFASQDNVLFRIEGSFVRRFFLSDNIAGLDFADDGTLWAVGTDDADRDGLNELYTIDDPFGTPTLSLVFDGLNRRTTSLVWEGDTLYGIQGSNLDSPQSLVTIDPATGAATPVGATGNTGINPEQVGGITIKEGQMWALQNRLPGELFTIDWTLADGDDPTATLQRTTLPATTFLLTNGLDVDPATGQLWAMIRTSGGLSSDIGVYTLDESTGQLDLVYDLSALTSVRGASGIAVIPEPATIGLLLIATGLIASRAARRR